jgi:PAS domain S-box-containing protein
MLETLVRGIIPQNDEQRLEALHSFEILYTSTEGAFDNITQMMAQVFKAPMAFISLVDKETVFYKSKVGPFDRDAVRREDSLCSLTILGTEPLVIEDASGEVCFQDNPYVSSTGGIRFYAGAPLTTKEGFQIGTACIVDTIPRTFSENDKSLLVRFASLVMHEIEMRRGALFQIQMTQDIIRKNKQLQSLSYQLKRDKERFDLVAKATQDAIWDWDLLTDEIWWNEGFKELFGYRDEEIETSIFSWTNRIHPDDEERVVNGIHQAIDKGGKNWSCEYRFRKADGSYAIVFDRG